MRSYWPKWDVMIRTECLLTLKSIVEQATQQLSPHSPSARLDAELLLSQVLQKSRAYLYAHPEFQLTIAQQQSYQDLIIQRIAGTPIAYLTGTKEFWSLPLQVNSATLIPRPETELLVELTLDLLSEAPATILDMGTGSGAIALALASERPEWKLIACDKSLATLKNAHANMNTLAINNVHFMHSNWFESIPYQQFTAIVSNPPYIAADDPHLAQGDVRFEPREALVSGVDGLDDLYYLILHAQNWLVPGGFLLLEHGFDQGSAVVEALQKAGYQSVQCWKDWQGLDRVSGGQKKFE